MPSSCRRLRLLSPPVVQNSSSSALTFNQQRAYEIADHFLVTLLLDPQQIPSAATVADYMREQAVLPRPADSPRRYLKVVR